METKNVMIVGVGGQGSLLASKLLGKLLTQEGFDVKVSEVHGRQGVFARYRQGRGGLYRFV